MTRHVIVIREVQGIVRRLLANYFVFEHHGRPG